MRENKITAASCRHLWPSGSICGTSGNHASPKVRESGLDAEPVSPGHAAQKMRPAAEVLPGTIVGEEPVKASTAEPSSQGSAQSEVPGRLWDPSDPPVQVNPAWQSKRDRVDKELTGPSGSRTRFPARLPPLSGLSCKGLLRLSGSTSTPVLALSELPEPTSPPYRNK